jgi:RNA polymerase sigma-70 factor (ECF subfamily)
VRFFRILEKIKKFFLDTSVEVKGECANAYVSNSLGVYMLFQPSQDGSGSDFLPHETNTIFSEIEEESLATELLTISDSVTDSTIPALQGISAEIPAVSGEPVTDQAINQIFEMYNQRICTFLGHLVGNDEVGRDLAQETFIKAWKALPKLQHPAKAESWLFRIARNTAIDYLRRKKIQHIILPWTHLSALEDSDNLQVKGVEDQICGQELVKQALACVKPKLRTCLILYTLVGFSRKKIAEILEIDEASVATYVSMGRNAFRQAYERLKEEDR